jgi:AcrR family transcriptional regulator
VAEPIQQDGRRARSHRTRARVVDAATGLFLEHGYVATRMEAVAAQAGVAVPTVYYLFRTKPSLLAAVLDATVAGPAKTTIVEQSWVDALASAPLPEAAMRLLAAHATVILARASPIYDVVRRAAAEPDVAALLAANRRARRRDQRRLAELLAQGGHLSSSLDVDAAADVLYGLVNEEVFLLLTTDCGWDRRRFEDWLTSVLRHELVDPVAGGEPC